MNKNHNIPTLIKLSMHLMNKKTNLALTRKVTMRKKLKNPILETSRIMN